MEPFATEPSSGDAGKRAIVEIGPHDLPMPAGGWIELVLDDDARPAELAPVRERGGAAPKAPAASPRTSPRTSPRAAPPLRPAAPRRAGRRWLLLPEALVVAGFLLAGAGLAVALRVSRAPAGLASPAAAAVAATLELARRPAELPRPRAGRAVEDAPPIRASSPVDLAPPPEPSLAPWGGAAR